MNQRNSMTRLLEVGLIILILAIGTVLRLTALRQIPPALSLIEASELNVEIQTPDEDPLHLEIQGNLPQPSTIFTFAAGIPIKLLGDPINGRFVAALAGIVLLVEVYLWIRLSTQNHALALASMAGLAASFWGMMISRLATSASLFPVFFMGAALAMRSGFVLDEDIEDELLPRKNRPSAMMDGWGWFVLAGLMLGITLHTFPRAQLLWLVFPAFFLFLSLEQPGAMRRIWPGVALMLVISLLVAFPLVREWITNPGSLLTSQLSTMLAGLVDGNPIMLRQALRAAVGLFTIKGDPTLALNIPGKPLLGPIMSMLFYIGVSIALISYAYPYRPSHHGVRSFDESFRVASTNIFMLLVLSIGLLPVVGMGIEGSMLSSVGMLPALYYFPALAIQWMADRARQHVGADGSKALWVTYSVGLLVIMGMTAHAYFVNWAR